MLRHCRAADRQVEGQRADRLRLCREALENLPPSRVGEGDDDIRKGGYAIP